MELTVLGCHGGETKKHRTSSFLIDQTLAVDAGAITGQLSLDEQQRIETVVVSHAHLDHIRDLAPLVDNRCQQGGPPLRVVGLKETLDDLKKHFFNNRLWPDFSRIPEPDAMVIYEELEVERPTVIGKHSLTPVLVNHTVDSAALIIDDGENAVAYSGDTGPTDRLWEVVNETERLRSLIVECSFPDDMQELANLSGHHTPTSLAEDLKKLSRDDLQLMIFHIKPLCQAKVERELAKRVRRDLEIMTLGDQFLY